MSKSVTMSIRLYTVYTGIRQSDGRMGLL